MSNLYQYFVNRPFSTPKSYSSLPNRRYGTQQHYSYQSVTLTLSTPQYFVTNYVNNGSTIAVTKLVTIFRYHLVTEVLPYHSRLGGGFVTTETPSGDERSHNW
jgi:hypothetical protein